ncbi:MAG: 50S ribosomal protein L18 [Candidatus Omnitrophica bacterium]|nr:50S ribosomal protein L18 [Candidatus Omnitrophota bacterium]
MQKKRITQRKIRHNRLRKKAVGTSQRPRLCVYRSLNNLSAQIVDDISGKTLLSLSTFGKELKSSLKYGGNTKAAQVLGGQLAQKAKAKGVEKVVFDRGGYRYHGRVKVFAEAARKAGLVF